MPAGHDRLLAVHPEGGGGRGGGRHPRGGRAGGRPDRATPASSSASPLMISVHARHVPLREAIADLGDFADQMVFAELVPAGDRRPARVRGAAGRPGGIRRGSAPAGEPEGHVDAFVDRAVRAAPDDPRRQDDRVHPGRGSRRCSSRRRTSRCWTCSAVRTGRPTSTIPGLPAGRASTTGRVYRWDPKADNPDGDDGELRRDGDDQLGRDDVRVAVRRTRAVLEGGPGWANSIMLGTLFGLIVLIFGLVLRFDPEARRAPATTRA